MPKWARDLLIAGVVFIIVFLLAGLVRKAILDKYQSKQTIAQNTRTATATTGIAKDGQVAGKEIKAEEEVVEEAASNYRRRVAEDEKANPVVRDWRNEPIPSSMLRRAKEREAERNGLRLSEDRSADDGTAPRTHRVD